MYIFTGPTLGQIQEKTKLRTFLNLTFSLPKPNLESTQTQKIPKIELPEQTPNFEHSFTGNGSPWRPKSGKIELLRTSYFLPNLNLKPSKKSRTLIKNLRHKSISAKL